MGKVFEKIEPHLKEFIQKQKLFFVSTAPLSQDGLVNVSPKGWDSLRTAGATARQMLINAAAKRWEVDPSTLTAADGIVTNGNGDKLGYGELAVEAAGLAVPKDVKLKEPSEYKIIGHSKPNVEINNILSGKPLFGIDTKEEGMVYAASIRPPSFGMSLDSFDDSAARDMNGVIDVLRYADNKITVLANNTWTAFKAKEQIKVKWKITGTLESTTNHDKVLLALLDKKSAMKMRFLI